MLQKCYNLVKTYINYIGKYHVLSDKLNQSLFKCAIR